MVYKVTPLLRESAITRVHYVLGLSVGSAILVVQLYLSSWRLDILFDSPTLILLVGLSTSIMKFLSGIGIMLTYASFCSLVFRTASDMMRSKSRTVTYVKMLLGLPVIAIAGYAVLKLYTALLLGETLTLFETLLSLYGVWSVVATVYILPALAGKLRHEDAKGVMADLRSRLSQAKYSLWRGYQFRIRRDFGKVYAKEFERYHDRIEAIRGQLSGLLLLPMCVVLVVVPPLAALLFILWLRMLSMNRTPLSRGEVGLLTVSSLCVLFISSLFFLSLGILSIVKLLDLSYGLGILGSILLLAYVIKKS